jgi:hypothetical protein
MRWSVERSPFFSGPRLTSDPFGKSEQYCSLFQTLSWYGSVLLPGCNMLNNDWEELYLQTILETDAQKMLERAATARQAIAGRLRDLEGDSDHHTERHRMETALKALETLESESRNW